MISTSDIVELARLVKCLNIALDSGDDDLFLRQALNNLRIHVERMQQTLGIVAAGNPLDLT